MSVLYGLLYMFFIAYPIVFQEGKGYSASITELMFIPLAIGVVMSAFFSPWVNKHYLKQVEKYNGKPPAEIRLIPMMYSCWCIPIAKCTRELVYYPGADLFDRPVHFRLDVVPTPGLVRSRFWRLVRRVRVHLPLQQCQQLSGRHLPASSCQCSRRKDLPQITMGCSSRAVHHSNVPPPGRSMGFNHFGVHGAGVLRDSLRLLLQGGCHSEGFQVCICWRRREQHEGRAVTRP